MLSYSNLLLLFIGVSSFVLMYNPLWLLDFEMEYFNFSVMDFQTVCDTNNLIGVIGMIYCAVLLLNRKNYSNQNMCNQNVSNDNDDGSTEESSMLSTSTSVCNKERCNQPMQQQQQMQQQSQQMQQTERRSMSQSMSQSCDDSSSMSYNHTNPKINLLN